MNVRLRIFLNLFVACLVSAGFATHANGEPKRIGINTVVIDAGHGGKDAGAVGRMYKEKDINLDVALRLGKLIGQNYPGVKVVYTRSTDVFIPLNERGQIANRADGDLFISIHTNSAKSSGASGVSTYIMGIDKTQKNLDMVMKENDVVTYEDDYSAKYQGYKAGSAESYIIFSLMQFTHQSQSNMFASMIQKQFVSNSGMPNRGVQQGPFLVLWAAAMPRILAEFGFISNSSEERFIGSDRGRATYARCLFNAFSEYKVHCEGRGTQIVLPKEAGDDEPIEQPAMARDSAIDQVDTSRKEEIAKSDTPSEGIVYRIQVASSPNKVPKNSSSFGPYRGEVTEIVTGNRYKYFVGCVKNYSEALTLQREVRKHIHDAYAVALDGNHIISIEEARQRK